MEPTLYYEKTFWNDGKKIVCGVDEVGRGSWAGPMFVGAVVFDPGHKFIDGINDSKKLTSKKREELYKKITSSALAYSIGIVKHYEIDNYGLTLATKTAIERAVQGLGQKIDVLLMDTLDIKGLDCVPIKKGDEVCYSISCASILAKVERDKHISEVPEAAIYGFGKNKGYGTKEHLELIKKHGISDIHRKSFKPIRVFCD